MKTPIRGGAFVLVGEYRYLALFLSDGNRSTDQGFLLSNEGVALAGHHGEERVKRVEPKIKF